VQWNNTLKQQKTIWLNWHNYAYCKLLNIARATDDFINWSTWLPQLINSVVINMNSYHSHSGYYSYRPDDMYISLNFSRHCVNKPRKCCFPAYFIPLWLLLLTFWPQIVSCLFVNYTWLQHLQLQTVGCAESDENFGYRFSKNRTEPTSSSDNKTYHSKISNL